MKRFELTYTDGKIHSGKTLSDWNSCPTTGVQCITYEQDDEYVRRWGFDYYILADDNKIVCTDILIQGSIKEGELTTDSRFLLLRESLYKGGPSGKGHSEIWGKKTDAPFTVGVRQGVDPEN